MDKVEIDDKAIQEIKTFAHTAFMQQGRFDCNNEKSIQTFCILAGLESYLNKNGVEVQWKLKK
jgi:hypothetical protein